MFGDEEMLIQRIISAVRRKEKFTFLVGSGLTCGSPDGAEPGVSNVAQIVKSIQDIFSKGTSIINFEDKLNEFEGSNEYQKAMQILLHCEGQESLNEVIVKAVLNARIGSSKSLIVEESLISPQILDGEIEGWHLRPGVKALGELAVRNKDNFIGPILTSNFDPLIEISIKKNNGRAQTVLLPTDGAFDNIINNDSTSVVHFHGYWHGSDTLHTVEQITRLRPLLKGNLRKLCQNTTLIVIGYGGWNDVLTSTLLEIISEGSTNFNIIWTFYSSEEREIMERNAKFFETAKNSVGQRLVLYKGIDCNVFLPKLISELSKRKSDCPKQTPDELSIIESITPDLHYINVALKSQNIFVCDNPPSIDFLVGRRNEIESLTSSNFKAIFITGIGGQGKSGLASYFVRREKIASEWEFWDWRDFKEEENRLHTKIVSIIERITNGNIRASMLEEQNTESLLTLLFKHLENRKILFVFDNIDNHIDLINFVPAGLMGVLLEKILTTEHKSKFIFTCRPEIKITDSKVLPIHLTGLQLSETISLFDLYEIKFSQDAKLNIIKESQRLTNGHPLWLHLIAAQASRSKDTVNRLLEDIKNSIDSRTSSMAENYLQVIWKALNFHQKTLLRGMAESVRAQSEKNLKLIMSSELKESHFTRALATLRSFNLIVIKTDNSGAEEFELHPIVKHFIRGKYIKSERTKYISLNVTYYNQVIMVLKKSLRHDSPLSFFENWTNKIELDIAKEDYQSGLITLHEIESPISSAGYIEEHFRVLKLLFERIDWQKAIFEDYNYFPSQFKRFIYLNVELGKFEDAELNLEKYHNNIAKGGINYLRYCNSKCYLHWYKGEFDNAIVFGEKGLALQKSGSIDGVDIEHNLSLAYRDSKDPGRLELALKYFLKGEDMDNLLSDITTEDTFGGTYYGNVGRCLHFLGRHQHALFFYKKAIELLKEENDGGTSLNTGYAYFWIGQIFFEINKFEYSYCFLKKCESLWSQFSPPRVKEVESSIQIILSKGVLSDKIKNLSDWEVEKFCVNWIVKK